MAVPRTEGSFDQAFKEWIAVTAGIHYSKKMKSQNPPWW